jgi:hypothetical protein
MKLDGELLAQAQRYIPELRGDILGGTALVKLASSLGEDETAMLFYQSILNSRRDKEFIRHINQMKRQDLAAQPDASRSGIEVALVPSSFATAGVHEIKLAEVVQLRTSWRKLGFKTEVIETAPQNSLSENAKIIGRYLAEGRSDKVILVSQGRGSAEVRLLLQQMGAQTAEFDQLSGWISVCGTLKGSHLFQSGGLKLNLQKKLGYPTAAWQQASIDQEEWKARLELPLATSLVQIVGVPKKRQLSLRLQKGFENLRTRGLSDGIHLLNDLHVSTGLCYPVWGLNPGSELWEVRGIIERTLVMMASLTKESLPVQNVAENQWSHNRSV